MVDRDGGGLPLLAGLTGVSPGLVEERAVGRQRIYRVTATPLAAEGAGTRLLLEHSGFDPDDPTQQLARRIMGGGWRSQILRRLAEVLDG